MDGVHKVTHFFRSNANTNKTLKDIILQYSPERHNSGLTFVELIFLAPYFASIRNSSGKIHKLCVVGRAHKLKSSKAHFKANRSCKSSYQNYRRILQTTLQVTTASVERSYSTMKRLKTLPRNLMKD
nr:unnamed protein product [Callosobruchus analis]